jgi:hypothetical protein
VKAVQFSPDYCDEARNARFKDWDSSHDLSIIDDSGKRIQIGHFKSAVYGYGVQCLINENPESFKQAMKEFYS